MTTRKERQRKIYDIVRKAERDAIVGIVTPFMEMGNRWHEDNVPIELQRALNNANHAIQELYLTLRKVERDLNGNPRSPK